MDGCLPEFPLNRVCRQICIQDGHAHHSFLFLQYATTSSDYDGMVLPYRSEGCIFLFQRMVSFRSFIFCGSALKSL